MAERLIGIAGSMFSGKTEELLRRIRRQEIAGNHVQVVKPKIDDRWGKVDQIRSHAGGEHPAFVVGEPDQILDVIDPETRVVAIDEIQFFAAQIVPVVDYLLAKERQVIFSGLPLDFRGEPFGSMPELLARADEIVRLTAICTYLLDDHMLCRQDATRTQRLVNGNPAHYNDPIILVGAEERYAARCPSHHIVPGKPGPQILYQSRD